METTPSQGAAGHPIHHIPCTPTGTGVCTATRSLSYSLHSVAIPKHDVVSEGAVNIQIYLLDF